MRKIEIEMNRAIANGTNWSKANTSVSFEGETAEVRLHGNLIARVGEGFIELFDGGWQTTTTKSRLKLTTIIVLLIIREEQSKLRMARVIMEIKYQSSAGKNAILSEKASLVASFRKPSTGL